MNYDVGIVGLGYVGLTLAVALADSGLKVVGVEKRADVVDLTNRGKAHFSENGLDEMLTEVVSAGRLRAVQDFEVGSSCSTYVITVGTPLDSEGRARLDFIQAATKQVGDNMHDGALVILRSTVMVGTSSQVVRTILEATGKKFELAMCPERTLEGKALQELRHLPQIVGADQQHVRERAATFFNQLTQTVVQVSSLEAAEIVKLIDNTYRDVQFGFANEVARVCESFGVNALEVINGGKLGYPRTDVALPGLVGGPCLEKDPHILNQSANLRGINLDITSAARSVNENQPAETVRFINREFQRRSGTSKTPKIAILGIAFKGIPPTDDLRGAMSLKVLRELRATHPGADIRLFDPVADAASLGDIADGCTICDTLSEAISDVDIAVITNNHPVLANLRPAQMVAEMASNGFVYDYWNHFSNLRPDELGDFYFAVGNTRGSGLE